VSGNGGGKVSVQHLDKLIQQKSHSYICRTDIKGYYANINKIRLLEQLRQYVSDHIILDLLYQFLYYSVESGGLFHTPKKGIPRSSALSPLLGAFYLYQIDQHFAQQNNLYYARYMDDFIILTRSRWQLRRAVASLNQFFAYFQFHQHPNKTFIGKINKGFDWMGVWFTHLGAVDIAPRARSNKANTLLRLYVRTQHLPDPLRVVKVKQYLARWERWKTSILTLTSPSLLSPFSVPVRPVVVCLQLE
uniref:reverse transcriptase domain-containing protein n=1 Tax=Vibrio vulnificus TaxID=672 RepID=UPI001C10CEDF